MQKWKKMPVSKNTVFARVIVALFLPIFHCESLGATIMRGNLLHNIVRSSDTDIKTHYNKIIVTYQMFPD